MKIADEAYAMAKSIMVYRYRADNLYHSVHPTKCVATVYQSEVVTALMATSDADDGSSLLMLLAPPVFIKLYGAYVACNVDDGRLENDRIPVDLEVAVEHILSSRGMGKSYEELPNNTEKYVAVTGALALNLRKFLGGKSLEEAGAFLPNHSVFAARTCGLSEKLQGLTYDLCVKNLMFRMQFIAKFKEVFSGMQMVLDLFDIDNHLQIVDGDAYDEYQAKPEITPLYVLFDAAKSSPTGIPTLLRLLNPIETGDFVDLCRDPASKTIIEKLRNKIDHPDAIETFEELVGAVDEDEDDDEKEQDDDEDYKIEDEEENGKTVEVKKEQRKVQEPQKQSATRMHELEDGVDIKPSMSVEEALKEDRRKHTPLSVGICLGPEQFLKQTGPSFGALEGNPNEDQRVYYQFGSGALTLASKSVLSTIWSYLGFRNQSTGPKPLGPQISPCSTNSSTASWITNSSRLPEAPTR